VTFTIQKVRSEGTTEPYVARLWAGVINQRELALGSRSTGRTPDAISKFDEHYEPILRDLDTTRNTAKTIIATVEAHRKKVISGEIIQLSGPHVIVKESSDDVLRDGIANVIIPAARAIKNVQRMSELFDINIGCLFQKQANFDAGVEALRRSGLTSLGDYLVAVRSRWTEALVQQRIDVEHGTWRLPSSQYPRHGDTVEYVEPHVNSTPVSVFVKQAFTRSALFVENIMWHCYQTVVTARTGVSFVEIPASERNPIFPERFDFPGSHPHCAPWVIYDSEDDGLWL
jgi:hypothetical protein